MIHCESRRKVTPGHSFKTWAIECFGVGFFFFEVCRKRHFASLGGVFKCLTFISDGKRQLFIFKEGIFNLTVHYLEKYSSIVQQKAYRGMFASLKVQILKVHV